MREYFVSKAMEVDPREPKLPAWAREKFKDMRRATGDAVKELAELKGGTTPTDFWLESWEDGVRYYLPKEGGRLMCRSGDGHLQITAETGTREDGWINISGGSDGVIVAPQCSNVVLVRNQNRHE